MTKIYFIRISSNYFDYYYYYIILYLLYYILLVYIFVISYYKNLRLLILIQGFKQKGKRLQKQDFKTLRGLLVYSLLFRLFNILVISRLGSLVVYQKAVYFYCCVVSVSFVNFTDLILRYMNLMNNGQMDRGNENPTQHLP